MKTTTSPTQTTILSEINRAGRATVREIARALEMNEATVRRNALALVAAGLVGATKSKRFDSQQGEPARSGMFGGAGACVRRFWVFESLDEVHGSACQNVADTIEEARGGAYTLEELESLEALARSNAGTALDLAGLWTQKAEDVLVEKLVRTHALAWSRLEAEAEDPNEVAPCLVCGEPKPNSESCPSCADADRLEAQRREKSLRELLAAACDQILEAGLGERIVLQALPVLAESSRANGGPDEPFAIDYGPQPGQDPREEPTARLVRK